MRTLLVILGAALVVASISVGSEVRGGSSKSEKRIAQIEQTFDLHFIQVVGISIAGKPTDYWGFAKFDQALTFLALAFCVPVGATDKQVVDAMASGVMSSNFYESMIKSAVEKSKEQVQPNPSPTRNSSVPSFMIRTAAQ